MVYRAEDTKLRREVALKFLPKAMTHDSDARKRFIREARAASALDHPHICTIHDIDETSDGQLFIVMAYYDGETLKKRIERGPITVDEAVRICREVAEGLQRAHQAGITHRDIKPANVMITSDGAAKIVDFGLAKLRHQTQDLDTEAPTGTLETSAGMLIGTVAYMSPEQVRGQPADHRSDIFALGCVFYEMLTGHRAFRRDTAAEIMTAILREEPRSFSESGVEVAPEVAKVIQRCVEKNPEDRFQSAADLALALGAESEVNESPVVPKEPVRRRRWLVPTLAFAGIVVVALGMVFGPAMLERFSGRPERPPIRSIAVLPLENLTGDPEQQYFVDGLHEELIATLSQLSGFDKVIARTSVMGFRDSDTPIREIGEQLDVDAVLEGSVRRSGTTVRTTLQLLEADTEEDLWSESFDRDVADILTLQREMARAVAQQVRVALQATEDRRLAGARRVDERAVDAYLRASYSGGLTLRERIALLGQAIEIDPTFASAHSALANQLCLALLHHLEQSEAMPRARAAALKAVELDNTSATAHLALGRVLLEGFWDWSGAEAEYRLALDLDPNSARAHRAWGIFTSKVGRFDEAITHAKLAVDLDPLSIASHRSLVAKYYFARRYDEAIESARRSMSRFPGMPMKNLHNYLAWCLTMSGRHAEAMHEIDLSMEDLDSVYRPYFLGMSGWIYARAGREEKAVEFLNELLELSQERYVAPTYIVGIYGALGQDDLAIEWLEKAYDTHDTVLTTLKTDPIFDPLRDDPRFLDILHRMNFPEN